MANIITDASTAAKITAEVDHLRKLISSKTIADTVFLWALAIAGVAAIVVFVCTFLSMRWADEITDLKDRSSNREIAKARADGIAEGAKAGVVAYDAGERAGLAQAGVDAAQVEIARQKTLTASANREAERIKEQVAWRDLSSNQSDLIWRSLSDRPLTLTLRWDGQNPEAEEFAIQIGNTLLRAGLTVNPEQITSIGGARKYGIWLIGRQEDVSRVQNAFSVAGLKFSTSISDTPMLIEVGIRPRPQLTLSR